MNNEKKTPIGEEIIRNNPTGHGLFAGIGDNFNSVAQVICELADDAISNLRANSNDPDLSMTVVLSFEDLGDAVEISVVDGGTGISDLNSALTIACRDGAQTPLNEHGFGLKHALRPATAAPASSGVSGRGRKGTRQQTGTARLRRLTPWALLRRTSP